MTPARAATSSVRRRRLGWILVSAGVVFGLVGFAVAQLGPDEDPGDGENGGDGGNAAGAGLFDDFSDPTSGWETGSDAGVTAEYVDGTYRVRFDQDATPGALKVSTGGTQQAGLSLSDQRVSVQVRILGESDSRRDGFGLTCRASPAGAYYFIASTSGGWSIQKRVGDKVNARTLVDSGEAPTGVPIRGVNELRAECVGGKEARLTFTVNGTELPPVIDRDDPLPAGLAGLTVAGPTLFEPDGLAVAFDDFRVEDLSALGRPSG